MDLYTRIDIPKSPFGITHHHRILMLGSCFIENMGAKLIASKFDVNLNPFGILYNPQSIAQSIDLLLGPKPFTDNQLFMHRGIYHSFRHHGRFSDNNQELCLQRINQSLTEASAHLVDADILLVTFGTAYVYRHIATDMVVGNCHKLPASEFDRYRLTVSDIVTQWTAILQHLKAANPKLKVIFTISPIRHLKDGAHDNQLSKSTLLLAIEQLCEGSSTHYFPSYEIVLDELRDYRFYAEDMLHPNDVATKYIWQRFADTYFDKATLQTVAEWEKLRAAIHHRPLNEGSEEHKLFLEQTLLKLKEFDKKYPYICCKHECAETEGRIK